MPQTLQEAWWFLVDWLPAGWGRPLLLAGAVLALVGVLAAAFNPMLELAQRLAPGPLPSLDQVLKRLAEGHFGAREADYVLLRIESRTTTPKVRASARASLIALARKGAPVEREAVRHFALGDLERGFALLQGHFAHAAKPTARALRRLRALAAGRKSERAGKYAPLGEFFEKETEAKSVTLSFTEIERVLGSLLPTFARKRRSWWANEADAAHAHARAWIDAGWKVASVDLSKKGGVVFERAASQSVPLNTDLAVDN
jgi:hypothetical protein